MIISESKQKDGCKGLSTWLLKYNLIKNKLCLKESIPGCKNGDLVFAVLVPEEGLCLKERMTERLGKFWKQTLKPSGGNHVELSEKKNTFRKVMELKWKEHIWFPFRCFWITTVVSTGISKVESSYLVMNGPAIGRLYQDLVSQFGDALDVLGSQRCPALPGIHILSPECHHWLLVETSGEAGSQPGQSWPLRSQHLWVW